MWESEAWQKPNGTEWFTALFEKWTPSFAWQWKDKLKRSPLNWLMVPDFWLAFLPLKERNYLSENGKQATSFYIELSVISNPSLISGGDTSFSSIKAVFWVYSPSGRRSSANCRSSISSSYSLHPPKIDPWWAVSLLLTTMLSHIDWSFLIFFFW